MLISNNAKFTIKLPFSNGEILFAKMLIFRNCVSAFKHKSETQEDKTQHLLKIIWAEPKPIISSVQWAKSLWKSLFPLLRKKPSHKKKFRWSDHIPKILASWRRFHIASAILKKSAGQILTYLARKDLVIPCWAQILTRQPII